MARVLLDQNNYDPGCVSVCKKKKTTYTRKSVNECFMSCTQRFRGIQLFRVLLFGARGPGHPIHMGVAVCFSYKLLLEERYLFGRVA